MTSAAKSVTRVAETSRGPLVVTLTAHGVLIREKGKRTTYGPVSYEAIMDMGAKIAARQNGFEAPRARKVRRG